MYNVHNIIIVYTGFYYYLTFWQVRVMYSQISSVKNRPNTFNADGRIGTVGSTGSTNGAMSTGERVLLQLMFALKGPGHVGGGRETVGCRVTTGGCLKMCCARKWCTN